MLFIMLRASFLVNDIVDFIISFLQGKCGFIVIRSGSKHRAFTIFHTDKCVVQQYTTLCETENAKSGVFVNYAAGWSCADSGVAITSDAAVSGVCTNESSSSSSKITTALSSLTGKSSVVVKVAVLLSAEKL